MSDHKRIVCPDCDKVLLSCRCPEGAKNIEYEVCPDCENKKS